MLTCDTDDTIAIGEYTRLHDRVPFGLFESDEGNRYLINHIVKHPNQSFEAKVAIALVPRKLQPFTWQALSGIYMDHARWLGAYRLRFTHAVPPGGERNNVGTRVLQCLS